MRMCANKYELSTNANATCTSNYDNIRQNTNMFDEKIAKFVTTLRFLFKLPSIRDFVYQVWTNNLFVIS